MKNYKARPICMDKVPTAILLEVTRANGRKVTELLPLTATEAEIEARAAKLAESRGILKVN